MKPARRLPELLLPRHWGSWLAVALLRAVNPLPYPVQLALGRGLGRVLYRILPRRRHIADVNLRLCFPEWSAVQRRSVLLRHFESLGTAVFEAGLGWWAPATRLRRLVDLDGIERVAEALQRGRGAILLGAHFTSLDLCGRLLAEHLHFYPLYRHSRNPVWDHVIHRGRQSVYPGIVHRDDLRGLVGALRANQVVWYAPDQDFGLRQGVFAPFFGHPAATLTTTSRLVRLTGAALIPFFHRRLPRGRYLLEFQAPLQDFPTADPVADAARVNALIEAQVRLVPEQYLWAHRRFKTRPPEASPIY
jgi:KDO2-lipid IV(A) lauroyltransferase